METTQVSPASSSSGADKRRTTRVVQAVPIVVRGLDALGQSFKESTTTVMVNCNGCKYRSRHYVPKDSRVSVEIRAATHGAPPRVVPAKVVWVQRPRTFREIFHVALEFEVAGNVWGIQDPPEDWFRHPDDDAIAAAPAEPSDVQGDANAAHPAAQHTSNNGDAHGTVSVHAHSTTHETAHGHGAAHESVHAHATPVATPTDATPAPHDARSHAARRPHFVAEEIPDHEWNPPKVHSPEVAAARDMVRPAVKAAMAREISKLRDRLQAHLRESLGDTIRSVVKSMADEVERELVEQAAVRTAEIVVEARKACEADANRLNEKIRQALREVMNAPQSAQPEPGAPPQHFGKKKKKNKKGRFEQDREPVTTP